MFQKKIAYGNSGYPWKNENSRKNISYEKGICPIAESLQDKYFISFNLCLHQLSSDDLESVINVFHKVWGNLSDLKKYEKDYDKNNK